MSGQQVITFPDRERHPAKRVNDSDTCVEPSEPTMSKGRLLALTAHAQHVSGLTDFELADHTGKAQTSIGKRRKELEVAGYVVATTQRRLSPSGALATVYRITPDGIRLAQRQSATEVRS